MKTSRQLHHSKSTRVQIGRGTPSPKEGSSGDLSLRMTKTGLKLFARFQNKWYVVGQGNLNQLGGEDQDQLFTDNNQKISTVAKKGVVKIKEKGLIELYPWKISTKVFDTSWANEPGLQFRTAEGTNKVSFGQDGQFVFENSASALYPQFWITNSQNNTGGPWLNIFHNDANPVLAQDFGRLNFMSQNDAGESEIYGYVSGQASSVADGTEAGKIFLRTRSGGSNYKQIVLVGNTDNTGYASIDCDLALNGSKLFMDAPSGDTYLHSSAGDQLDYYVGGDLMMRQVEGATVGNFTQIFGGEISVAADNASSDLSNYVLELTQTLNDTSDSGTSKYKGLKFILTNTDITGWDEIYMMHLAGAGTTWINNTGSIAIPAAQKIFLDGGTDAANGHTYITESSDDVIDVYVGGVLKQRIVEGGTSVFYGDLRALAEGGGTYTSSSNSSFQTKAQINADSHGAIIGYTALSSDGSGVQTFEIQDSLTVEDDTHKITFNTPASEYVEISASCIINVSSTDTRIQTALSTANATDGFSAVAVKHSYNYTGVHFGDDEIDDFTMNVKWVLGATELASVGSSNTFWIAFSTAGVTKTAYLSYGSRDTHNTAAMPFIIKATSLPDSIYDGT